MDIKETQDHKDLYNFLIKNKFVFLDDHEDILKYAKIYKFIKNNDTAGYVWLYQLKPKEYNLSLLLRFSERIPVFGELSELYKLVGVYPDH